MERTILVLKKRLEKLESYYSQEKDDNILIDISIEIDEINKLIKFLESLEQTIELVIVPNIDKEPEMAFNQMKILKILTELKPEEEVLNPEPDSNSAPSDSFDQILREEFLINSQNFPEEYHELFWKKYKRAEERFKNQ